MWVSGGKDEPLKAEENPLVLKELKQAIPIPVKLFGLRLDKLELAYEASLETTILEESKRLKQQIALLPNNSVVIVRLSGKEDP